MTDVDEVVGTETEGDLDEGSFVEPPNRFDRIKESYKGVTSALDLSEETAAYDDFQSLLTDHKVRACPSSSLPGTLSQTFLTPLVVGCRLFAHAALFLQRGTHVSPPQLLPHVWASWTPQPRGTAKRFACRQHQVVAPTYRVSVSHAASFECVVVDMHRETCSSVMPLC